MAQQLEARPTDDRKVYEREADCSAPRVRCVTWAICAAVWCLTLQIDSGPVTAQSREEKVRNDRQKFGIDGIWIYNDFTRAVEQAKRSGQPILAVMRCVPCVDCVKLDDDVMEDHPQLQELLRRFVRVRLISTNGLDLRLFQFDTDQSFNVMIMNADGTIYGRYGTRSHHDRWQDDVSVDGLAAALQQALELHRGYPGNQQQLAAKQGDKPLYATPEQFPTLKERYKSKLSETGAIVPSCIHCHQIGDAIRSHHFSESGNLPEEVLFPYPHPKALGLILDPKQGTAVLNVDRDSVAAGAGFQVGDRLIAMNGQPLISIADVQWVLHHVPAEGGKVAVEVSRDDLAKNLTLTLKPRWREKDDIAWRASTWELRRKTLGGLYLLAATAEEKKRAGIAADRPALRVQHVGQYAPHDVAKRAGFRVDDLIVQFDEKNFERETDLIRYVLRHPTRPPQFDVAIRRGEESLTLKLPHTAGSREP